MSLSSSSRSAGSPSRAPLPFWHVRLVFAPLLSAALLGVTYLYWHHAEQIQQARRRQHFEAAAERVVSSLQDRMVAYEMVLRGLRGYVDGSKAISQSGFATYVEALQLDQARPGLQALCLLERVPQESLRAHVLAMRAQGFERYEVRSRGGQGMYAVMTRVEPRTQGNLSALGFDAGSLPAAREAMDRARDTGMMALSGLWSVGGDEDPGLMMFLPLYAGGGMPDSLDARRAAIQGWVAAPFRMTAVVDDLLRELDSAVSLRIQDGQPWAADEAGMTVLYGADDPEPRMASHGERLHVVRYLTVGGRPWTLTMEPLAAFDQKVGRDNHGLIAWLGVLISVLAGWFIALQATGHQRALALARSMTSELRTARDDLEGILHAVPDLLFELDMDGHIHYYRSARSDFSSAPSETFEGRSLQEILPADVAAEFLQAMREARAQGVSSGRQYHLRTSGGIRWFELSVARKHGPSALVSGGDESNHLPDASLASRYVALARDVTSRREAEATMHRLAYYDALTGLPNRRLLFDQLQSALDLARRQGGVGALFFIDLDNFKQLNDARGHPAGDRLLVQVARRLERLLQGFGSVVRIGGDEFVVLIPRIANGIQAGVDAAGAMAARLREGMEAPHDLGSTFYAVTASTGVTLFPKGNETVEDLLREADTAMYRAKSFGSNRVCFFEADMQASAQERLSLEQDLGQAVVEDALDIHIHPQVDSLGSVCGGELLLRWVHPVHGRVSPVRFVAIAEESGLILRIGARVIRRACDALARLHAAGRDLTISVNVSARQFRQDDFVAYVRDALAYSGAPASRLILEVTETLLVENWQDTAIRMAELVKLGVRFSIDDFGTGYSSLAYLKRLPLYELKIDKSFVQDAPDEPNDAAIVRAILSMAHHLRLRVVAEGVETSEQAAFLASHGCDAMQGYLYAQPVPLKDWLDAQAGEPAMS
ncbi:EAL domain-containing protein [Acidovorax sp. NCPPB 2350]|nr:EAL domain-containing protein [Acidovorax sp. NCPPB 2350]